VGAKKPQQHTPSLTADTFERVSDPVMPSWDADGVIAEATDGIVSNAERDEVVLLGTNLDTSRQNHHGGLQERNRLTAARARRVLSSIRGLSPPELALSGAGITKGMFASYVRLAEDDEAHPIYRVFLEDYNRVTEEVCRKIVHNASDIAAIANDPKWHMYLLERFHPAFRAKVMVEVEHQINIQLNALIVALEGELSPEIFERVLEVAASLKPGETTARLPPGSRNRG
jgi:hypothetical protein